MVRRVALQLMSSGRAATGRSESAFAANALLLRPRESPELHEYKMHQESLWQPTTTIDASITNKYGHRGDESLNKFQSFCYQAPAPPPLLLPLLPRMRVCG